MFSSIELILEISKHGSLKAAAQYLKIPKSKASRLIQLFEKEHQIKLLDRKSKPAVLMPIARLLLEDLESIQIATANIKKKISGSQEINSKIQTIRLSLPVNMGRQSLMEALQAFNREFPSTTLEIQTDCSPKDLIEGKVDIAWFGFEPELPNSFCSIPIGVNQTFLMATPQYINTHKPIDQLSDLVSHVLLVRDRSNASHCVTLTDGSDTAKLSESQPVLFGDALTCKSRLLNGEGIAFDLNTGFVVQELGAGKIVPVLKNWRRVPWHVHLAMAKDKKSEAAFRKVVEIFENYMAARSIEHWQFWFKYFSIPWQN